MRLRSLLLLAGGVAAVLATAALAAPRDLVLYNHSPSAPVGFYVRTNAPVAVGAFVTVRARDVAPEQAASRGFDDASDRFIKRVAAAAGARVCGDGRRVVVSGDNIVVGRADDQQQQHAAGGDGDHAGGAGGGDGHRAAAVRVLHAVGDADVVGWRGCRVLAEGEVLLLGDTADSFDGRYWGPVRVELIEGVWRRF